MTLVCLFEVEVVGGGGEEEKERKKEKRKVSEPRGSQTGRRR